MKLLTAPAVTNGQERKNPYLLRITISQSNRKTKLLKPLVSVIIPVLNTSSTVDELLDALNRQTYPRESTEIIIIDNGSADDTVEKVRGHDVTLLIEHSVKSPYAARNRGFEKATGSIIALTDANKIPDRNWIENGVKALENGSGDVAGGNIRFNLGEHPSIAEIYDSVTFNNNKNLVENEGGSAAGNLFFKREVLEQTGLFPENFRSGMDIWWTQKAVKNGFKLVYAEDAVVICKPRKFKAVLKKSYRVGVTHPFNLYQSGKSVSYIIGMIIRTFAPPRIQHVKKQIEKTGLSVSVLRFWGISWLSKICLGFGRMNGLTELSGKLGGRRKTAEKKRKSKYKL